MIEYYNAILTDKLNNRLLLMKLYSVFVVLNAKIERSDLR